MFSTLRTRFGIPGVISVIALVFAMFGGAYAASNSSNAGKATASAKAKKGPRGPKGATGPAGPAGAQGHAGPAGAKGDTGANGAAGAVGPPGPTGPQGPKGTNGTPGAPGATGPEGSPWTAGGTLPPGKTETGTWGIAQYGVTTTQYPSTPISFPIPVPTSLKAVYLDLAETVSEAETGGCKWEHENMNAKPEAPTGTLCVFTEAVLENKNVGSFVYLTPPGNPTVFESTAGPAGAYLNFNLTGTSEEPAELDMHGVWAVTP